MVGATSGNYNTVASNNTLSSSHLMIP